MYASFLNSFLGVVYTDFYLASRFHTPRQTIDKFSRGTSHITENGMLQFLQNMHKFKIELKTRANTSSHRQQLDYQPITLVEFYLCLVLFFGFSLIFVLICVCEMIWIQLQRYFQKWMLIVEGSFNYILFFDLHREIFLSHTLRFSCSYLLRFANIRLNVFCCILIITTANKLIFIIGKIIIFSDFVRSRK